MNSKAQPDSLRIFIVENHADTLDSLQSYLEFLGHTVFSASSLLEARQKLPLSDCEVLISDIGLSDGTGWELIKDLQLPRPIFAIALSGYGMEKDRTKSLEAGFRHHLVKPSQLEQLDEILAEAFTEMRSASL